MRTIDKWRTSAASARASSTTPGTKYAGLAATMLVLAGGVGVGGYIVGRGSGEDLEAARTSGTTTGRESGTLAGGKNGYAIGFKQGSRMTFEAAYQDAYLASYRRAFEDAGLDVPAPSEIKVSTKP